MSYYYRRQLNETFDNIDITYEDLAKEHKSLSKMINNLIHHAGVNTEWVKMAREYAKKSVDELIKNQPTVIQQKAVLQKPVDEYFRTDGETGVNYSMIKKPFFQMIGNAMIRQERILKLQSDYLNLDEVQMSADRGGIEANSYFRSINTANMWRSTIDIKGKKDCDPMLIDYSEELEDQKAYVGGKYGPTGKKVISKSSLVYYIDQHWVENVKNNGIMYTDIGGKQCLVTTAKEVTEHELKDQDVKLYDCTVVYTKIPLGDDTYQLAPGKPKDWFNIEKRHVAVQTLPSGETQQASGKDKSWAIRTMKMRMKSKMLKQMGLK